MCLCRITIKESPKCTITVYKLVILSYNDKLVTHVMRSGVAPGVMVVNGKPAKKKIGRGAIHCYYDLDRAKRRRPRYNRSFTIIKCKARPEDFIA